MNTIDRAIYARCSDCDCTSADLAAHGNRCPLTCAATKPGDLHETRDERESRPHYAVALLMIALCFGVPVAWHFLAR